MFTQHLLVEVVAALLATVVITVFTYYQWSFRYWKRKNVPQLQPTFPFGNFENPLRRTEAIGIAVKHLHDLVRANGWKHCGIYSFSMPRWLVTDLDCIKNVLTKDFQHFVDRGSYVNEEKDPLSAHLFAIGGVKWRNLRTKMTPTFTSGKMKSMFQTLVDCEASLQEVMAKRHTNNARSAIDIKEVLGCFATDIIGSCAFGLDCNTFKEDDSPFRIYGKKTFSPGQFHVFLTFFAQAFPDIARTLGLRNFTKDIGDFFIGIVKNTVEHRERNKLVRNDFLQMLIEMKNDEQGDGASGSVKDGKKLTMDEIAAQCFVFFLAGFETSSSTVAFALYELSKHPHIQDRLRSEVSQVLAKHDGKITYDSINDMKYMNQVIDEALRKYPPIPFITRVCVRDYKIPDEDVTIEEGTGITISILGIHYDPDIYPDPEKFDPERFSEDNKKQRHQYAHIPFGEGPRICIGKRFGLMQSKVALTSLIRDYRFSVDEKTQEPLRMTLNSLFLATIGDIWLNAEKIKP